MSAMTFFGLDFDRKLRSTKINETYSRGAPELGLNMVSRISNPFQEIGVIGL